MGQGRRDRHEYGTYVGIIWVFMMVMFFLFWCAEKVFNYIKRLHKGNLQAAISKALEILEKRSKYIRAMNLMMVTTATKQVHVLSYYNESPDYFTLFEHEDDDTSIISSVPLSSEKNWQTMPNRSIREY